MDEKEAILKAIEEEIASYEAAAAALQRLLEKLKR